MRSRLRARRDLRHERRDARRGLRRVEWWFFERERAEWDRSHSTSFAHEGSTSFRRGSLVDQLFGRF